MFKDFKQKQRWSIRKLTIGAVSVLLGTYFAVNPNTVKADSLKNNDDENYDTHEEQNTGVKTEPQVTASTKAVVVSGSRNQNGGVENFTHSNDEGNIADEVRDNNQKVVNKVKSLEQAKPSEDSITKNTTAGNESQPKQDKQKVEKQTQGSSTSTNAQGDAVQPFSIAQEKDKSGKVDAEQVAVSKVEAKAADDNSNNGGLDESVFGKLDVNAWDTNANNDGLNIVGYHGADHDHLIVPNAADFVSAGRITNADAVITIDSAKFKDILHTFKPKTVAISKTDGKKVRVSDQNAFGGGYTTEQGVSYNDSNLVRMDLSNLDTSNLTDTAGMFDGADNITDYGDISGWDMSHVTNTQQMFDHNLSLRSLGDLSHWNLSKVTNVFCMFRNCPLLHVNVSNWDLTHLGAGGYEGNSLFYIDDNKKRDNVIIFNNVKYNNNFNINNSFRNGQVVITNDQNLLNNNGHSYYGKTITINKYGDWQTKDTPQIKTIGSISHSIFFDSKGSNNPDDVLKAIQKEESTPLTNDEIIDKVNQEFGINADMPEIPADAIYVNGKPSTPANSYSVLQGSNGQYHIFRSDEIPMTLSFKDKATNEIKKTITFVANGIWSNKNSLYGVGPKSSILDLKYDNYIPVGYKTTTTLLSHFGFDGLINPRVIDIEEVKEGVSLTLVPNGEVKKRTITVHFYKKDIHGNPVIDTKTGNYVSVAPDFQMTFTFDKFERKQGGDIKDVWQWNKTAPTVEHGRVVKINKNGVEGWQVTLDNGETAFVPIGWGNVHVDAPQIEGLVADASSDYDRDPAKRGYHNVPRATEFVHPTFSGRSIGMQDSGGNQTSIVDTTENSVAYTSEDDINNIPKGGRVYEAMNDHIIWYYPKSVTVTRTIKYSGIDRKDEVPQKYKLELQTSPWNAYGYQIGDPMNKDDGKTPVYLSNDEAKKYKFPEIKNYEVDYGTINGNKVTSEQLLAELNKNPGITKSTDKTEENIVIHYKNIIKPVKASDEQPGEKTVTRIIHFEGIPADKAAQYQDQSQKVTFTRVDQYGNIGYQDKDHITYNKWHLVDGTAPSGSFEEKPLEQITTHAGAVYTPQIDGKTVTEVAAVAKVTVNDPNRTVTVKYNETTTPIPFDSSQEEMYKTITRTITVNYPEGVSGEQPAKQEVNFSRKDAKGNAGYIIDGVEKMNDWHIAGDLTKTSGTWVEYDAPSEKGYRATGNAKAVTVTSEMRDQTVKINYQRNADTPITFDEDRDTKEVTRTINFETPAGVEAKSPITQTVKFSRKDSKGNAGYTDAVTGKQRWNAWHLVDGTAPSGSFEEKPLEQITTHAGAVYTPQIDGKTVTEVAAVAKVTVNDPNRTVTVKYNETTTPIPFDSSQEEMYKTITRTITVNYPEGVSGEQPAKQEVNFSRKDAKGNAGYIIDGVEKMNDWHIAGDLTKTSGTWVEYDAPSEKGYRATGNAKAVTVTSEMRDQTVTIEYTSVTKPTPIDHHAKAHILYFDDDTNEFLQMTPDGSFTATDDPHNAYEDLASGKQGTSISFNSLAWNKLKSIYELKGISKDVKNSKSLVSANNGKDPTLSMNDLGMFDGDPNTDQYFIIHLHKKSFAKPDTGKPDQIPVEPHEEVEPQVPEQSSEPAVEPKKGNNSMAMVKTNIPENISEVPEDNTVKTRETNKAIKRMQKRSVKDTLTNVAALGQKQPNKQQAVLPSALNNESRRIATLSQSERTTSMATSMKKTKVELPETGAQSNSTITTAGILAMVASTELGMLGLAGRKKKHE